MPRRLQQRPVQVLVKMAQALVWTLLASVLTVLALVRAAVSPGLVARVRSAH
ncbi:MAG: hypothetical protein QE285_00315 [Aquabacterium sp.]|nr:hypothetical protein [Aquabacterium sp.]